MSHPKPQPPQGWDALCAAAAAEGAEEPALTTTHTAAADSRTDGLHAASATTIRLLHRDGLQSVLSLLTRDELWSARLVSVGWAQTAALERRRRMIQLQTQIVTLISNNEAAGRAWKELCAASDPAAVPSLQSDALSTMLRCISISEPSSANALSRPRAARAIDLMALVVQSSSAACEELLSRGALTPLLSACTHDAGIGVLRSLAACFYTFTRLTTQSRCTDFEALRTMLPILSQLLYVLDDTVLAHTLAALAVLSDDETREHSQIQAALEVGVSRRVVELLVHKSGAVKTAAVTLAANLCGGDNLQRQVVLNCAALPCLSALLSNADASVRFGACVALSRICAGNRDQIESVINANLIPALIELVRNGNEPIEVRMEAVQALCNAIRGGDDAAVRYLAAQGVLPLLSALLVAPDDAIVITVLESLDRVASVLAKDGSFAQMFESANVIAQLTELQQHHPSQDIRTRAALLLENFAAHATSMGSAKDAARQQHLSAQLPTARDGRRGARDRRGGGRQQLSSEQQQQQQLAWLQWQQRQRAPLMAALDRSMTALQAQNGSDARSEDGGNDADRGGGSRGRGSGAGRGGGAAKRGGSRH